MKNIVLIGAGQLGSRHLQALGNTTIDLNIEVVDPSKDSRDIALQRFNEIDYNPKIKKISFFNEIKELSVKIDLVVIATSSNIRSLVLKELIEKRKIKNLVLEKVLFQTVDEYYQIQKLLKDHKINCWVNHPRRMFPFYNNLKAILKSSKQIHINVQGGDWGLACNSLHYLDLFTYLTGSNEISINTDQLNNEILTSKRDGYIEFNGMLSAKINDNSLSLISLDDYSPSIITINSNEVCIIINESSGDFSISQKKNDWKFEKFNENVLLFQSELSHIFTQNILVENSCNLPKYEDAMLLHINFIKVALVHLNKISSIITNKCQIT